jgi:hypothetical protein
MLPFLVIKNLLATYATRIIKKLQIKYASNDKAKNNLVMYAKVGI